MRDPSIQRADNFANTLFRVLLVAGAIVSLPFVVFGLFAILLAIGAFLGMDGGLLVLTVVIAAVLLGGVLPIAVVLNAVLGPSDAVTVDDASMSASTFGPFYPYPEGTWRLVAGHGLPGMRAGSAVGLAVEDGRLRFYSPGVAALASEPLASTIVTAVDGGTIEIHGDNVHVRLAPLDVEPDRVRALLSAHPSAGGSGPHR